MSSMEQEWSARGPLAWGFSTLLALLGLGGAWSVLTTLSGAIIAQGQIEVSQSRQVVQHPDGGVVREILVQEGASVKAGDVLMRLDGSELGSELTIVTNQIAEHQALRARLEAQRVQSDEIRFPEELERASHDQLEVAEILTGQQRLFQSQREMIVQAKSQRQTRINQIMNQIDGFQAQMQAVETQVRLTQLDLSTQRDLLAKGLSQAARVSALERELAQLSGRLGELVSAIAEANGRITEIEIEITALVTQQVEMAETNLRDVVARERELLERRRALEDRISRLEIQAPASGLVLGLQVTTPQSVIRPADAFMYIVPQDRPLLVAAKVPVTHVDEVRPGQNVRLVFSSLPVGETPEVEGEVTLVSADALSDERTGMNYFRAEIAMDAQMLEQLGEVAVVPGMPVDAFIRTDDRTPLSYLLKPFTDYFRNAFRET